MPKLAAVPSRSRSQQILTIRREHWDHDGYDPNARRVLHRVVVKGSKPYKEKQWQT